MRKVKTIYIQPATSTFGVQTDDGEDALVLVNPGANLAITLFPEGAPPDGTRVVLYNHTGNGASTLGSVVVTNNCQNGASAPTPNMQMNSPYFFFELLYVAVTDTWLAIAFNQ